MSGSEILVACLEREGVDTIFAYPGGASMEIHQALTRSKKIRTVLDRGALKIIDPVLLVDQGERWAKLYEEIIVKGSR